MKKTILSIVIIVLVFLIGYFIFKFTAKAPSAPGNLQIQGSEETAAEIGTVIYADGGYSPGILKVKAGTTITFKNESSDSMWTASAIHPTHTYYPGSDIKKCGTPEQKDIFDACQPISPGESWSFTFNNAGTWRYHNHMDPRHFGAIEVE